MAWSDEFNQEVGSKPNPANWNYNVWEPGRHNEELQSYTNDREHAHIVADPAADDGHALQIEATTDGKRNYTSARIHSARKVTVQYGYLEARIKLPYGKGLWPAFWAMGTNDNMVGWPDCGEIDIQENMGSEPSINHGSFHGPDHSGDECLTGVYTLKNGRKFSDAYHTFGLLWSANSATLYVDGVPYETRSPADTYSNTGWAYNHPFFIILNLAVGGHFPGNPDASTVFPQDYRIDYIRLYKYTATKSPHGPHAIPGTIAMDDYDAIGTAPVMKSPHYSVNVDATSAYTVAFQFSSRSRKGAILRLEDENGHNLTGPIKSPASAATVTVTVALPAGFHVLNLVGNRGDTGLARMTFAAVNDIVSCGIYRVEHDDGNGECLDAGYKKDDHNVDISDEREGAATRLWRDSGSNAQRWIVKRHGSDYSLIHKGTGACLTNVAGSTAVRQSACVGSDAQLWTIVGKSGGPLTMSNKATNGHLAAVGGGDADGAAIEARPGAGAQHWYLDLTGVPGQP